MMQDNLVKLLQNFIVPGDDDAVIFSLDWRLGWWLRPSARVRVPNAPGGRAAASS